MTTAWVTGAKGFIGRYMALRLANQGIKVVGLGHGAWVEEEYTQWGVSYWINGEITQPNFDRLVTQAGLPDMIFHLAGGSSVGLSLKTPEEDFRRSVDSTIQLLEWTRNHAAQARLVLASSAAVYGAGHSQPICETDSLVPYSPYGYHKRMAELLFESYSQNFGLLTAVVRLFSVYGPELRKQLLWDLCNRCKTKPESLVLAGNGLETRDWLHVSDAVEYLNAAASLANPQGFVMNGGRGIGVYVKEVVELIRDLWNLKIPITFTGSSRPGDPHYLVANTNLAQSVGLVPQMDWQEGIKEYVKWFQHLEGK